MSRETDMKIARFLGDEPHITWEIFDVDETASALSFSTEREAREWLQNKLKDYPGSWLRDSHVGRLEHYKPYSSDISAAMEMEERIKELGLAHKYGKALCEVVGADSLHRFGRKFTHALLDGGEVFAIAHAGAEERAKAALEVVEER